MMMVKRIVSYLIYPFAIIGICIFQAWLWLYYPSKVKEG